MLRRLFRDLNSARLFFAVSGLLFVVPDISAASSELKVTASDGGALDGLGKSLAIDGSRMIVGALFDDDNGDNSGSAYIFDAVSGNQLHKLLPMYGSRDDEFGASVTMNGPFAVVGSPGDRNQYGPYAGSVFIFDSFTGHQNHHLVAEDGEQGDSFGSSVDIDGTTLIVGARGDDDNAGAAYLFDAATGVQRHKLVAEDRERVDAFGGSSAVDGSVAIVGASFDSGLGLYSGSAYLFDVETGEQLFKLLPDSGGDYDRFGSNVDVSDGIAIVAAPFFNHNASDSGAAYLFDVATGQQIRRLTAPDGAAGDAFGSGVAIKDGVAIVGAIGDDGEDSFSGSAYLFNATTGDFIEKLTPSDPGSNAQFGAEVALSSPRAIVSAPFIDGLSEKTGAVYVYTFGETRLGDADGDGDVDDTDLGIAIANFTGPVGIHGGKSTGEGDSDGDGDVDDTDLGVAISGFTGPLAVPEPTTLVLLGLTGILASRRIHHRSF